MGKSKLLFITHEMSPFLELTKIAEYSVPVSRDLEDAEIKQTAVWKLI